MELIAADKIVGVIGAGLTGQSVVRHFSAKGIQCILFDTRNSPPGLDEISNQYPSLKIVLGQLPLEMLSVCTEVVVSPGVSLNLPELVEVRKLGIPTVTDIQVFIRENCKPVIAITGSNGKSTVVTLLERVASAAGEDYRAAGNIGIPVLGMLSENVAGYILELSSFQLEGVSVLNADIACVLNVSADHMDRYNSLMAYSQAKQRVYLGAKHLMCNKQDPLTHPLQAKGSQITVISSSEPDLKEYGIRTIAGVEWLCFGLNQIVSVDDIKLQGRHNWFNCLVVIAVADSMGWSREAVISELKSYSGLPHRCEVVGKYRGITFINDSKATNPGATQQAIRGLGNDKNIILIAGGDGKGVEFDVLCPDVRASVKAAYLIGKDAQLIEQVISNDTETRIVDSLDKAVMGAISVAIPGDTVLLSPACASMDMFKSYEQRGQIYRELVEAAYAEE